MSPIHPAQTASKHKRIVALLLACSMLLGLVLGSGLNRLGRAPAALSDSLITQLILQDICRGHPSESGNLAHMKLAHMAQAVAGQTADDTTDNSKNTPPADGHIHCAACLIALDISLPQHGGTWRLKAQQLSLERALTSQPVVQRHAPLKLPSHAPPQPV